MQWQRHCTPKIGHCCRIRPPSGVLFVRSIISHETRGKYWLSSILLEIAIKLPLIFSLWHTVIYRKKQSTVDFEIVTHSITNNPPPRCIINWTSFVCLFFFIEITHHQVACSAVHHRPLSMPRWFSEGRTRSATTQINCTTRRPLSLTSVTLDTNWSGKSFILFVCAKNPSIYIFDRLFLSANLIYHH